MASLLQPFMAPVCAARSLGTGPAQRGGAAQDEGQAPALAIWQGQVLPGVSAARHPLQGGAATRIRTLKPATGVANGGGLRQFGRWSSPILAAASAGNVSRASVSRLSEEGEGLRQQQQQQSQEEGSSGWRQGPADEPSPQGQVAAVSEGTAGTEGGTPHISNDSAESSNRSSPKSGPRPAESLPPGVPPGRPPPAADLQKLLGQLRGLSAELAQRPGFLARPPAAAAPGGGSPGGPQRAPAAASLPAAPDDGGAMATAAPGAAPPRPPSAAAPLSRKQAIAARPAGAGGNGDTRNGVGVVEGPAQLSARRGASSAGGDHAAGDLEWVRRSELTAVRLRLNQKLSEANAHTRHLLREMEEREQLVKVTRRELAAVEAQLAEAVAMAKELAVSRGEAASKKVNGKYLTSLLAMRLEDVQDAVRRQAAGVAAADLREFPIVWFGMAEDVKVMGSFDGWTRGEQLSPEGTGTGTKFTATLKLRPGRYEVKFQVDGDWRIAPEWPTVGEGLSANNLLIVD